MTWLSLEGFTFASEQLAALIPHCTHLKYLNLNFCNVEEHVLIALARSVPHLSSLSIAHTQTSNEAILQFLQHCKNLKTLNVQRCSGISSSSIADFIPYMTNLQELNISHNPSLATEQIKVCPRELILFTLKGLIICNFLFGKFNYGRVLSSQHQHLRTTVLPSLYQVIKTSKLPTTSRSC